MKKVLRLIIHSSQASNSLARAVTSNLICDPLPDLVSGFVCAVLSLILTTCPQFIAWQSFFYYWGLSAWTLNVPFWAWARSAP